MPPGFLCVIGVSSSTGWRVGTSVTALRAAYAFKKVPRRCGYLVTFLKASIQKWTRLVPPPPVPTVGVGDACSVSLCTTSHPFGHRVSMVRARPEALVLLGALLTALLDPAGKYQAPLVRDVSQFPLGVGEGRRAGKRLPEAGRSGEMAERLSQMGNFLAQPRRRASIATWVGLGALGGLEKHGPRPSGPRGVAGRLALSGPPSDPQEARAQSR